MYIYIYIYSGYFGFFLWRNIPEIAHIFKQVSNKSNKSDIPRIIAQNMYIYIYTLWLFNIAMENDPFIDGLPGFTY